MKGTPIRQTRCKSEQQLKFFTFDGRKRIEMLVHEFLFFCPATTQPPKESSRGVFWCSPRADGFRSRWKQELMWNEIIVHVSCSSFSKYQAAVGGPFARFSSAHWCPHLLSNIDPLEGAVAPQQRMRRVEKSWEGAPEDVFEARALNLQDKNSTVWVSMVDWGGGCVREEESTLIYTTATTHVCFCILSRVVIPPPPFHPPIHFNHSKSLLLFHCCISSVERGVREGAGLQMVVVVLFGVVLHDIISLGLSAYPNSGVNGGFPRDFLFHVSSSLPNDFLHCKLSTRE